MVLRLLELTGGKVWAACLSQWDFRFGKIKAWTDMNAWAISACKKTVRDIEIEKQVLDDKKRYMYYEKVEDWSII